MNEKQNLLLLLIWLTALSACAGREAVDRQPAPNIGKTTHTVDCPSGQVAVCVDVNCEPEEYQCADKENVKRLLGVRDFPDR